MENKQKKVRGKYYTNYTEINLQIALSEIEHYDLTISEAAKKFNIPIWTLRCRLNNEHSAQHGNTTTLTQEDEKLLAEYILNLASLGSPLTRQQIIKTAGEIAALDPDETKHFKSNQNWASFRRRRRTELKKKESFAKTRCSLHFILTHLKFYNKY